MSPVIPHRHYPGVGARFYDTARSALQAAAEPPPAHQNPLFTTPPDAYAAAGELTAHLLPKSLEGESEQRDKERKTLSIPGMYIRFGIWVIDIL